jgi:hypothetical protein
MVGDTNVRGAGEAADLIETGVSPFDFAEVPVMDGVNHTSDTGKPTRRAGTLRFIPS